MANAAQLGDSSRVAAQSSTAAVRINPAISAWLTLCLVLQLGLARVWGFDPTGTPGPKSGVVVSQLLILATYTSALAVLLTTPKALQMLRRCWPVVALPALAILSTAWSVYPALTLQSAISYALTTMLGFAIAVALPPSMALGLVVRAMGYVCILSTAFALFYPELGVHQATEVKQFVHAGLWRGILAHKVNLGIFSGLAFPLVIFYRRPAFKSSLVWLLAVTCSAACLWNAGSITGMLGSTMLFTLLVLFQQIGKRAMAHRVSAINVCLAVLIIFMMLLTSGLLNKLIILLDRSPDLTGRAEMWPAITDVVQSSPVGMILGFGYVAGMAAYVGPVIWPLLGWEPTDCHNGYLEVVVAFGYGGAMLVFFAHAWIFRGSKRLLLGVQSRAANFAALPISLFITGAMLNYSESQLLAYGSVFTQLTPLIAVWFAGATRRHPNSLAPARHEIAS